MNTDFSQVEQSALALPQLDRARLVSVLLRSLDSQVDADPELIAEEWKQVILARSDALHQGSVSVVSGEEVISELRNLISGHEASRN
jgi:putative addiction module component (TIGR02574 family)